MKILIISDDFPPNSFGGAGVIALGQARELVKRGHEVSVITTTQNKKNVGERKYENLNFFSLYSNLPENFRSYLSIYNFPVISAIDKIISKIQPDVVHIHNIHSQISYHTISIAKKYSKKIVMTFHDVMPFHYGKLFPKIKLDKNGNKTFDYKVSRLKQLIDYKFRWNPIFSPIVRSYLKKVDVKISVSHALKDAFEQNGIKGMQVLHNGIDVNTFVENKTKIEAFKEKYKLQNKKVMFLGGRLSGAKGGSVAINLLVDLSKEIENIFLLVVGREDDYAKKLIKIAEKSGVGGKMKITGWLDREEIVSAYYSSDLVLVPSIYLDPFPTVNLEAMACKKPVIGTKYGGTSEVILDSKNGFIIDPYNPEEVFQKTKELLSRPNLMSEFGQNGYNLTLDKFDIKKTVDKLIELYEK